jgi:hypothetical protein
MKKKKNTGWKKMKLNGVVMYRAHRKYKGFHQYLLTTGKWKEVRNFKDEDVRMCIQEDLDPYTYIKSRLTVAENAMVKMKQLLLKG